MDRKQEPFKINMTFPTSEMLGKHILSKLETTEAWVVPIYPDEPQPDQCSYCNGSGKDYGVGGFDSDFADCPKCKPDQSSRLLTPGDLPSSILEALNPKQIAELGYWTFGQLKAQLAKDDAYWLAKLKEESVRQRDKRVKIREYYNKKMEELKATNKPKDGKG